MSIEFRKGWSSDMPVETTKNLAYWERNMLALLLAQVMNQQSAGTCGWYYDTDNNWDGWKRVISLDNGRIGFHIPDDFNVGDLPLIEANWDGHTTQQKWEYVMSKVGVRFPDEPR